MWHSNLFRQMKLSRSPGNLRAKYLNCGILLVHINMRSRGPSHAERRTLDQSFWSPLTKTPVVPGAGVWLGSTDVVSMLAYFLVSPIVTLEGIVVSFRCLGRRGRSHGCVGNGCFTFQPGPPRAFAGLIA